MTTTPAKPAAFTADGAPAGVEIKFVTFWTQRRRMAAPPRLQLVHTNAANGPGTIDSAWNWAHAAPNVNTLPHYQVDLDGRARKMLPTDRVGIANQTVAAYRGQHGTVQDWSIAIETADTGVKNDPTISAFTPAQAERVAQILAYESITHGIPLALPTEWHGAGTAAHTDPFGYPYWTTARGKTCPGAKKKAQLRNEILPRAREIAAAWTAPTPAPPSPTPNPPEDDDMPACAGVWKYEHDPNAYVYAVYRSGYKVWLPTRKSIVAAQSLLELDGVNARLKSCDDRDMFIAFGPVLGPRPGGVNEWGIPL